MNNSTEKKADRIIEELLDVRWWCMCPPTNIPELKHLKYHLFYQQCEPGAPLNLACGLEMDWNELRRYTKYSMPVMVHYVDMCPECFNLLLEDGALERFRMKMEPHSLVENAYKLSPLKQSEVDSMSSVLPQRYTWVKGKGWPSI